MRTLYPGPGTELDEAGLAAAYSTGAPGSRQLRLNFATSLDGAGAVGGRSAPLSGPADKLLFRTLRGLADVVLVGQSTVLAEDYGPVRNTTSGHTPPIAVTARTMRMDPDSAFFREASSRPFLLVADDTDVSAFVEVAEILRCGPDVDLAEGVGALAHLGLTRVLCEGGPRLASELLSRGLVDELCLTLAPRLSGPGGPRLLGGDQWADPPLNLALLQVLEQDGFLFTRYGRAA